MKTLSLLVIFMMLFSEKEFKDLAELLRHHNSEATRIEMAPWAKGFTVDVKDIHTELTLETEPKGQIIQNYKQIFLDRMVAVPTGSKFYLIQKVLIKGKQGFGKSSLAKRILFDWSKRNLTEFDIVFFISMKSVRSDDEIGNIIVQQVQPLIAMNIVEEKIEDLLDNFGSRCLIVLDGFGEDSERITKMLRSIHSRCSILATSLPDTSPDFNQCFDTIAEIQAMTDGEVKQYISHVPNFCPENIMWIPESPSPLLILFLSIITDSGTLFVPETNIGDIYLKLILRLCSRFAFSSALERLSKLGEIALRGLIRNQYSFLKREVDQELGEDELTSMFMVCHEGFSNARDSEGCGIVSFVHSFFQYFFAFLYFVLGSTKTGTRRDTEFMNAFLIRPNFCNFCLQLLRDETKTYELLTMTTAYTRIKLFLVEKINHTYLHLNQVFKCYPSMDITSNRDCGLVADFGQTVLSMCKKIRHVVINHSLDFPLQYLQPIWPQLFSVQLLNEKYTPTIYFPSCSANLVLITDTKMIREVKNLVDTFKGIGRQLHLYYAGQVDSLNISEFPLQYLEELYINPPKRCKVNFLLQTNITTYLKRLSLCNVEIDDSVYFAFTNATTERQLCNLSDLSLASSTVTGKLNRLFKPKLTWPSLVQLDLDGCYLKPDDVKALEIASLGGLLPCLRSLSIDCRVIDIFPLLLVVPQITVLRLQTVSKLSTS